MYSIPKNFNLSQLNKALVQQVCFAANVISLMLENSRYISFEGEFILTDANGNANKFKVYPVENDFGILKLIEQEIIEITVSEPENDLHILFENKMSLIIIASKYYESYTIKTKDDFIRV
jgi:hypothetical protein